MSTTADPTSAIIGSSMASGLAPAQVLEQLDSLGIDWFITEQGDLMVKTWQIAAKDFVVPAKVPMFQAAGNTPDADPLNWMSEHLEELRAQYPGQWIAVAAGQVQAAAPTLPVLLGLITAQGLERPFVTQVPAGEIPWMMTYARQDV